MKTKRKHIKAQQKLGGKKKKREKNGKIRTSAELSELAEYGIVVIGAIDGEVTEKLSKNIFLKIRNKKI